MSFINQIQNKVKGFLKFKLDLSGCAPFLFYFFLAHLIFFWLPQFTGQKFQPTLQVTELAFNGGDLLSAFESASRLGIREDVREVISEEDKLRYPYPIGGITTSYGGLSFILMWPFTHFSFEKVRLLFFFLSILAIYTAYNQSFKMMNMQESILQRNMVFLALLSLSGPITLLLERVNLEAFIPLMILPFYREFLQRRPTWKTSFFLGTVIHLKLWPIVFLPILVYQGWYRHALKACAWAVFWLIVFAPLIPIKESVLAILRYNEAAAQMWGWISISVYSLIKTAGWSSSLKWLPIILMAIFQSMIFLSFKFGNIRNSLDFKQRGLVFSMAIISAFLSPSFVCEYNLVNLVILIPLFLFSLGGALIPFLALIFVNLLSLKEWLGPVKVVCLLTVFFIAFILIAKDSVKKNKGLNSTL